jgi:transcriptional regulator with XRE-family HTH domain
LRAARSLLNWTVRDLSEKAGVHRNTITRAETEATAHGHAVAQVVQTLESAGVIFVAENGEGPGVRLRKNHMASEPIYVDASRSAVLSHGAETINCLTLQEAVIAFKKLPKERQEIAFITSAGRTFTPAETERLHYGPKPDA